MGLSPITAASDALGVIAFMNAAFGLRFAPVAFFFGAAFLAAAFLAGAFFATGFFAADFLAGAFFADDFFAAVFFVAIVQYLHSSRIAVLHDSHTASPNWPPSEAATACRGVHCMSTGKC